MLTNAMLEQPIAALMLFASIPLAATNANAELDSAATANTAMVSLLTITGRFGQS